MAAVGRMDGRDEPVRHRVWRAFSRNDTKTNRITATEMIAWSASSPSSPAPAARRSAASGLDCSARPSKRVCHAADALVLDARKPNSSFAEIPHAKLLTLHRAFESVSASSGSSQRPVLPTRVIWWPRGETLWACPLDQNSRDPCPAHGMKACLFLS